MLLTLRLVLQFQELNRDENVHGIVVQLPVHEVVDSRAVLQAFDSEEHADCLNSQFNSNILTGEADNPLQYRARAMGLCTPRVSWNCLIVMELLSSTNASLSWVPPKRTAYLCRTSTCDDSLRCRRTRSSPVGLVAPASFSRPTSACGQAACEERLIPAPVDGQPTLHHAQLVVHTQFSNKRLWTGS